MTIKKNRQANDLGELSLNYDPKDQINSTDSRTSLRRHAHNEKQRLRNGGDLTQLKDTELQVTINKIQESPPPVDYQTYTNRLSEEGRVYIHIKVQADQDESRTNRVN
jgi:hypothetical protein